MRHALVVVVGVFVLRVVNKALLVNNHAGTEAKRVVELAHPAAVELGEVIVDGHHVNAAAG